MIEKIQIKKVFIANRGEICRRIAITAKKMGITTVALTDKKEPPLFLKECVDEFIFVEEENPALYLNVERMIDYAKTYGCDAIHPGFGFLSENAEFAALCISNSINWIGPSPEAISALADKAKARHLAESAKIPCTPGLENFLVPEDESGDFSELEKFALKTGFPLLLKAAMGGGGKGMRLVREMADLKPSAIRAASEGLASFGSASLICEKFVEKSRHVEVQVLADKYGNVFAIGDRDCSVQRRHQKILEESPAPFLGEQTRKLLHESAVALAKEVGYFNAGTVEFLVEWDTRHKKESFQQIYFLEMNTRLQVEHPVTEQVHRLDLVECQFKVAMGHSLEQPFFDQTPSSHAIEARLYAENVNENFFPSPGKVKTFLPPHSIDIRWEVGIDAIDEITPKFDPMIAKIIATGKTREEAITKLADAIEKMIYLGPDSNRDYLVHLLKHTNFSKEAVSTDFITEIHDSVIEQVDAKQEKRSKQYKQILEDLSQCNLTAKSSALYLSKPDHNSILNNIYFKPFNPGKVEVLSSSDLQIITFPQDKITKSLLRIDQKNIVCTSHVSPNEKTISLLIDGIQISTTKSFGLFDAGRVNEKQAHISAEVPGKVLEVLVTPGDNVKKNEKLFVLESMKMEFEVKASKEGQITAVNVKQGEQVKSGKILANWADT